MNPKHNISKVNKKAFDKDVATNLSDSTDPSDLSRKYLRGGSMNDALRRGALEPRSYIRRSFSFFKCRI